ncbi:MAG: MgtC/SapB family protein [Mollicutes bacterium]|nr:MgtC/SapB family protein [Mollicutes bacterium]
MEFNDFLLRIAICYSLTIIIGFERQYHNKIIGLRTNVLVALGSFLFVYVSFSTGLVGDQYRIASQILPGLGFLGAGIIIKQNDRIRGLNTAATLWCVSSIGVLCAYGFIKEAIIGTSLVLLSNVILRRVSFDNLQIEVDDSDYNNNTKRKK